MRVRFIPTGRQQFLAALAYIRRDNPAAAVRGFENGRRTFYAALSSFPHQVGKSRSSQNSPIERLLCHRSDSSTASKTKRYGPSPSGMARNYLENPVHDCMRIKCGTRRFWAIPHQRQPEQPEQGIRVEINTEYLCWALKRIAAARSDVTIQGYENGVFWERNSLSNQRKEIDECQQTLFT